MWPWNPKAKPPNPSLFIFLTALWHSLEGQQGRMLEYEVLNENVIRWRHPETNTCIRSRLKK